MINTLVQFATMETPGNYGWFHIMFLIIIFLGTFAICFFGRNVRDLTFRIIIGVLWLICIGLEIYKQCTFVWDGDSYQWYAFPFQFCSSILYALPFIVFLPEGKVRQAFMAFAGLFMFFGGLAVYAYPNDVFVSRTGINIQTMTHHGLQVLVGIYVTVWNRKNILSEKGFIDTFKNMLFYILKGAIVFAGFIAVAIILNEGVTRMYPETEAMNMFYISTRHDCTLPVLSSIYPLVNPFVFILIYFFGFLVVAFIMMFLQYGILCLDKVLGKYSDALLSKMSSKKED